MVFCASGYRSILCIIITAITTNCVVSRLSTKNTYSECYTANGRDYQGSQSAPKVNSPDGLTCMKWSDVGSEFFNVSGFDREANKNFCRNPNNRLFPYCFVKKTSVSSPEFMYCDIKNCTTPALLGCYKLNVGSDAEPVRILDGDDRREDDEEMKIGRCLNFCRSKDYDYAGVSKGDSCYCDKGLDIGQSLKNDSNKLEASECMKNPCVGDRLQGCGGDNAIAIYDTEAGSCTPPPHFDRDNGIIYSPRWPGDYHNEAVCQWTIYIPDKFMIDDDTRKNYQLKISFLYLDLEVKNDTLTIFKYVNDSADGSILSAKYTGENNADPPILSFDVSEIVAFHMIFKSDKDKRHEGFIMNYTVVYIGPPTTKPPPTTPTTTTRTTTVPPTAPTTPTTPKPPTQKPTTQKPTTQKPAAPSPTTKTEASKTQAPKPGTPETTSSPDKNRESTNDNVGKPAGKSGSGGSLDGGAVAGIVIGVLLFVVLCAGIAYYVRKHIWTETTGSGGGPQMFNNPVAFKSDTPL